MSLLRAVIAKEGPGISTFIGERKLIGTWSHPQVPALVFQKSKTGTRSVYHGGLVASAVPIDLVFWGDWWTKDGQDRCAFIQQQVQKLIASPYFSALSQYSAGPPHFRGARIVTNPAPPMRFDKVEDQYKVADLVNTMIDDGIYPDPEDERILSVVFMPGGFVEKVGANGAHSAAVNAWNLDLWLTHLYLDKETFWFAWIGSYGDSPDMPLEDVTVTVSHEIAEAMTDPEPEPLGGWWHTSQLTGEIGDEAREPDDTIQTAFVNGVKVSAYWSNTHNATIIPIDNDYRAQIIASIKVNGEHVVQKDTFRPDANLRRLCPKLDGDRDYWFTVEAIDETARLTVQCERYVSPIVAWSVQDQSVTQDKPDVTVHVTASTYDGVEQKVGDHDVTVHCKLQGQSLTVSTEGVGANFDLEISCSVRDGSVHGALTTDVIATPSIVVGFEGAKLVTDPAYNDQVEQCVQAMVKKTLEIAKTTPVWIKPGPPGPVELPSTILAELPAYARVRQFRKAKKVATVARLAHLAFEPEVAQNLIDHLVKGLPAMHAAILMRRQRSPTARSVAPTIAKK